MASKEFIAKLKNEIDIVALVGETVQLRRAGKYLTGLSPFTKEKTPSFFVNPESQSFYCYSTNQGGDVITFLELTKGMSFQEAITQLASKAGLALEDEHKSPEQIAKERAFSEEKKLLWKLNRFAARFYQDQLEGAVGGIARDYIQKRGITPESVLQFAIGYAPESWTSLRDYFLQIKAPLLKAHEIGLFRTKGGEKPKADGSNLFDTFRNRLIFPIRDPQGEVVGFGGRWLGANSPESPKYMNSPESVIYEKEKILYNLDQARKSIRESESVVLVEGYMDCLTMVQSGFENVVANCGTALTRPQTLLLRKLAPKVICLYDADDAGQAATERAMNLFLDAVGHPMLRASLPGGKDPDEFLHNEGDAGTLKLAEILQNSPAALDLWIEEQVAASAKSLQGKAELIDKIAAKLSKLKEDLWIQMRVSALAKQIDMDADLIYRTLQKYRAAEGKKADLSTSQRAPSPAGNSPQRIEGNPTARTGPNPQQQTKQNSARPPEKIKQIQAQSGKSDLGFERRFVRELLRHSEWLPALREKTQEELTAILANVDDSDLKKIMGDLVAPLAEGESETERMQQVMNNIRDNAKLRNLFAEATMRGNEAMPAKNLEDALVKLKTESLKRQVNQIQKRIDDAEKNGNTELSESLLRQLTDIRRQRV